MSHAAPPLAVQAALLRRVAVRTVIGSLRGRRPRGEVLRQMYQVGNRSVLFIAVTLGFIGMVLVFQTCLQISRITGDLSQVGGEFVKILVHEFGPSLTAMMLATRVGAGIAAEIGTMVVTEQVDALRMSGVEPVEYLVVPRFLASLVMTAVLTCLGVTVAVAMGALTARASFGVNPAIFLDLSKVTAGDVITGAMKVLAYGAAIPVVSGFAGLSAHGGSEGVGKSGTIQHVVGLMAPDAGELLVDGQRVDGLSEEAFYPVRKRVAMVFQFATLFDSMSLLDNVALPLRTHKRLRGREAEAAAMALLAKVHLEEFARRLPAEVGDGMRKRAAIARALALEPAGVLFDEPTTGLDPVSARRIDRLIRELADDLGVTAIVVSHDLTSIFSVADRVAMVYRGVIHVVGTPAELRASPDPVVQQFIAGRSTGPMETPGF